MAEKTAANAAPAASTPAAITLIEVSPAPVASSSGRFTSTHSIAGSSMPRGSEWYVRQSTDVTRSLSQVTSSPRARLIPCSAPPSA